MVNKIIQSIRSIILTDPRRLFEQDRARLNEPFVIQGGNRRAVLLIHGWTSVPYEVRRLGLFLNERGYTVAGPMLRGHGTVPKDLENVRWSEWLADMEKEYLALREQHAKVYIAGTSIGANIAVLIAAKHPDVAGLVLMAMPYKFKLERTAQHFARLMSLFKKYNKKFYPPTFGVSTTITRLIAYQSYPIRSAFEAFGLIKRSRMALKNIKQPVLALQSSHDHMVVKNNLEIIFRELGSKNKSKRYVAKAYHTFVSDIKNEQVFEDILGFLEKN